MSLHDVVFGPKNSEDMSPQSQRARGRTWKKALNSFASPSPSSALMELMGAGWSLCVGVLSTWGLDIGESEFWNRPYGAAQAPSIESHTVQL